MYYVYNRMTGKYVGMSGWLLSGHEMAIPYPTYNEAFNAARRHGPSYGVKEI